MKRIHFVGLAEDIAEIAALPVHREKARLIYETMCELYRDIIPVRKIGQTHILFTPWDYLIRWWGLEEAMMDLIMRPDMVHEAVDRTVDAWMIELDQFVE
jgi:hypothetical protein